MTNDTFNNQFDNVKPGDKIEIHYGAFYGSKTGKAYGKGETKWGKWIRVKFDDYTFETIHGFVTVGIGAYLLK